MTTDVAGAAPALRGGFGRLWGAAVVSSFGDGLRGAPMALLAVRLTDSAFLVSLVAAAQFLPWLVFGLLGGAVADRVDQRRAMWAVDAVRAALMAVFAGVVWAGEARIWMLLVLAFALTTLQTLFDNAATALLPLVVPKDDLARANGRLLTGQQIAGRFVGSPTVPLFLSAGLALPFAVDALSFALAAALVATLRITPPEHTPRPPGRTLRHDMAEGLRAVWADRVLRAIGGSAVVANAAIGVVIGVLVVHITRWLDGGSTAYSLLLTAYGVGMVAGGPLTDRITRRLGQTRTLLWATVAEALAMLVFGAVRDLAAAGAALAVFGFAGMLTMVIEITVLQQRSPAELTGRVSAAFRTATIAGTPLGAVLGGALAELWAPNAPVLVASVLLGCAAALLVPAVRSGMN